MLISNKLISLLKTFSKHDLNSFKKFVNSPFHNENQELIELFSILDQYFRLTEKEQKKQPLEKEKVWAKIFGNKFYQDVRMRRLCSDLIKLIYSFLSISVYQNDSLPEQLNLLKALRRLSLKKHFESSLNQVTQNLEKSGLRNADYHLSSYNINYNLFNFPRDIHSKINLFSNLEKADYHLDCYYITKKLENYCDYIGYKEGISFDAKISLPSNFLKYVENSIFIKEPSLKAYFFVTKMLIEPEETDHFIKLKNHLESHSSYFTLQELDIFYTHLKNYCIVKINIGKTEYFTRLFEIFQTLIKEKVVLKDGIISPQSYKNIITVGLQVKEYSWVENFIQEYTSYLPKLNKENALVFNLSKVYFSQKKYYEVIKHLQEVKYKNHLYALWWEANIAKNLLRIK